MGEWELVWDPTGEGVRSLLCLMEPFWLSLRMREESLGVERRGRTVFPLGTTSGGASEELSSSPRRCSDGVAGVVERRSDGEGGGG